MQFRQLSFVFAEFKEVHLGLVGLTAVERISQIVEVAVLIGGDQREGESIAHVGFLFRVVAGLQDVGVMADARESLGGEFPVLIVRAAQQRLQ